MSPAPSPPVADHYTVLGLRRGADPEEVRRAWRGLARAHHPDKNPGGEGIFKRAAAAYAVLSDAGARREYDAALAADAAPGQRSWCLPRRRAAAAAEEGPGDSHEAISRARQAAASGTPVSGYCLSPTHKGEIDEMLRKHQEAERRREARRRAGAAAEAAAGGAAGAGPEAWRRRPRGDWRSASAPRGTEAISTQALLDKMQSDLAAREQERRRRQQERERARSMRARREEDHRGEMLRLEQEKERARREAPCPAAYASPLSTACAERDAREGEEAAEGAAGALWVPPDGQIGRLSPGALRRLRAQLLAKLAAVEAAAGSEAPHAGRGSAPRA